MLDDEELGNVAMGLPFTLLASSPSAHIKSREASASCFAVTPRQAEAQQGAGAIATEAGEMPGE